MVETLNLLDLIAARVSNPAEANGPYSAMASLISPSLAITPDHALPPWPEDTRGDQKVELHFERWSNPTTLQAVVVARDPTLDFAVLKLDSAVPIELPPIVLSQFFPPPTATWESLGFIPTVPEGVYVTGTVGGMVTIDGRPHLQLHVSPEQSQDWQGMSGAPVFFGGQLVGIMARADEQGSTWFAIAISAMVTSTVTDAIRAALPSTPGSTVSTPTTTELDEAALFERLSQSSRDALGHADGMRRWRGQDRAHMEHLIAGLNENEDGPTRRLMRQAGLDTVALHNLLAEAAKTRLPARNEYSPTTLDALPPLSSHVREALIAARNVADANSSEDVRSRHLIYGALSVVDCEVIQALQQHEEVRKENIALVDKPGLRIAGFRSDNPDGKDLLGISKEVEALCSVFAAKDVEPPLSLGLFGDWGSGKSFFMSQMEQQIEKLKKVARSASAETAYCTNIVQLKFNAWHYIDQDLWASLTAEIFEGLAQALAKDAALAMGEEDPEYARARLLAATATSKDVLAEAERKKSAADAELRESEQRLVKLEQTEQEIEASLSPKVLLREVHRYVVNQPEVQQSIEQAGKALNFSTTKATATEVKAQLLELSGIWGRVRALAIAIHNTRGRQVWLLLTLSVVLALLVGAVLVFYKAPLAAMVGSLLSLLGGISLAIKPFIPGVKQALGLIEQAQKEGKRLIKDEQERQRQELERQQAEIRQKAVDAQRRVDEAGEAVKKLEQQLDELRADRQMSKFIKQRYESTDYTKHFGVIARARNDFEQLSLLLAEVKKQVKQEEEEARQKKEGEERKEQTGEEKLLLPRIDRIILYIDDLDRCPENKVIDVLQAVHLLLAFPLFVVVVGVDPRWLLHSLKQHSKAFQDESSEDNGVSGEEQSHWQSTPLNYLEKIFQIPFTLWPMKETGFAELIDSLTVQQDRIATKERTNAGKVEERAESTSTSTAGATSTTVQRKTQPAEGEETSAPSSSERTPDRTVTPSGPVTQNTASPTLSEATDASTTSLTDEPPADPVIDINPEHLRIEEWERNRMKELFWLIPSPRAAKRFVNIYRLLRASVDEHEHKAFVNETKGQYRIVLLLLAILTGYPAEATQLLSDLLERKPQETWWSFIDSYERQIKAKNSQNSNDQTASDLHEQQIKDVNSQNSNDQTAGDLPEQQIEAKNSQNSNHQPVGDLSEAERWQELLEKLKQLRSFIPDSQPCQDFTNWAPKVARYSFQSGRILLSQWSNSAGNRNDSA